MGHILQTLNPSQYAAATHQKGPIIVIAGPGTGKTLTLAGRIEYLICQQHTPLHAIIALTFTRKAAQEMKDRLKKNNIPIPWIGTFHQLGGLFYEPTLPSRLIIPEEERAILIKNLLKKMGLFRSFSLREASTNISYVKQLGGRPLIDRDNIAALVTAYNEVLKKHNYYDYDDILVEAYTHLNDNSAKRHLQQFQHILVDEFQDTNDLQYKICHTLGSTHKNLFIIGDPHQSIYSFQGSSPRIFENVLHDFPEHTIVHLETNYRSARRIVQCATSFFPREISYHATSEEEGEVTTVTSHNIYAEARWIAHKIQALVGGIDLTSVSNEDAIEDGCATFRDCAVLYRTHYIGGIVEKILSQQGIPYQKIGEASFFYTKEVQKFVREVRKKASTDNVKSVKAIYDAMVQNNCFTKTQQLNIEAVFHYFFAMKNGVDAFLHFVDEKCSEDYFDPLINRVTLSTMHAAKGLEFPIVFIFGCNKEYGIDSEEEKRLLYVAATRAKQKLYITMSAASPLLNYFDNKIAHHKYDGSLMKDIKRKEKRARARAQQKLF